MSRTNVNFPVFVSICVEVSSLNLNLFLPIIRELKVAYYSFIRVQEVYTTNAQI